MKSKWSSKSSRESSLKHLQREKSIFSNLFSLSPTSKISSYTLAWNPLQNAIDVTLRCQQWRSRLCFINRQFSLAWVSLLGIRIQEALSSSALHLGSWKWSPGLRPCSLTRRANQSLWDFLWEWTLVPARRLESNSPAHRQTSVFLRRRTRWQGHSENSTAFNGLAVGRRVATRLESRRWAFEPRRLDFCSRLPSSVSLKDGLVALCEASQVDSLQKILSIEQLVRHWTVT